MKTKLNEVYEMVLDFDTKEEAKAVHQALYYRDNRRGSVLVFPYGIVTMTYALIGNAEYLQECRELAWDTIAKMNRQKAEEKKGET